MTICRHLTCYVVSAAARTRARGRRPDTVGDRGPVLPGGRAAGRRSRGAPQLLCDLPVRCHRADDGDCRLQQHVARDGQGAQPGRRRRIRGGGPVAAVADDAGQSLRYRAGRRGGRSGQRDRLHPDRGRRQRDVAPPLDRDTAREPDPDRTGRGLDGRLGAGERHDPGPRPRRQPSGLRQARIHPPGRAAAPGRTDCSRTARAASPSIEMCWPPHDSSSRIRRSSTGRPSGPS